MSGVRRSASKTRWTSAGAAAGRPVSFATSSTACWVVATGPLRGSTDTTCPCGVEAHDQVADVAVELVAVEDQDRVAVAVGAAHGVLAERPCPRGAAG